MQLTLCKLCQYADRTIAGNPMLIGLFSRMATQGFPTRLDVCFLVIEIEVDPQETGETYPLGVRLIDEDGRNLTEWQSKLEVPPIYEAKPQRTYHSLQLPWDEHFVFNKEGTYRFDVLIYPNEENEEVLGGETLMVHLGQPAF